MEIVIGKDAGDVARRAALRLEELCKRPGAGRFSLALAGGSTPKRLYELLAEPPFRDGIPWDAVEIFFGDERSVPPEHPDSNYGMAHRALLSKVPVAAHRMVAESGEADAYERLVRERVAEKRDGIPAFDLILLGMGKDGHTASLFPGTAALQRDRAPGGDERRAADADPPHDLHLSADQRGEARLGAGARRRQAGEGRRVRFGAEEARRTAVSGDRGAPGARRAGVVARRSVGGRRRPA